MSSQPASPARPAGAADTTLLPLLDQPDRTFLERLIPTYRLTHQEVRIVAQAARELAMWREERLPLWWQREEAALGGSASARDTAALADRRDHKRLLLRRLRSHLAQLADDNKVYPAEGLRAPARRKVELQQSHTDRKVFGQCPAYSDRTVCCNLFTIDAVLGCAFDCSYCTIQTFYGERAELPDDLDARLDAVALDPDRFYHVGTGQSSDSLLWGNRAGILDALCRFASRHDNIVLELKTKSDNLSPLLAREIPSNIVCSWSLNAETIVANEEHGTASLSRRLAAARRAADHGISVAFHFHPLVQYRGWEAGYSAVVRQLLGTFHPDEVAFLSLGTMTFIKPVAAQIRRRGGETKVLQMPFAPDPHGKLTYPDETKVALYQQIYSDLIPWHGQVYIYLCMEKAAIWQQVFGRCYDSNTSFDRDFARHWHRHRQRLTQRTEPQSAPQ